jgi:hypothetical protein
MHYTVIAKKVYSNRIMNVLTTATSPFSTSAIPTKSNSSTTFNAPTTSNCPSVETPAITLMFYYIGVTVLFLLGVILICAIYGCAKYHFFKSKTRQNLPQPRQNDQTQSRQQSHPNSQTRPQPPVIQPSVIQPSVIQPSVIQPSVIQPSVIQPSVIRPPVIQPSVIRPPVIQPSVIQPPVIQTRPQLRQLQEQLQIQCFQQQQQQQIAERDHRLALARAR